MAATVRGRWVVVCAVGLGMLAFEGCALVPALGLAVVDQGVNMVAGRANARSPGAGDAMQRTAEALKTAAAKTGRGKRGSAEEEPAEAPEEAPQPPAKGRPPRRPPPAEEPGRVALAPPAEGTEGGAGARVFACNYYVDLNGNGNPDADEFSGVKAAFKKSERIILVVDMPDPRPGAAELRVRTWNPQGKMILDVAMPAAAVPKFYRIGDRESGGKQYDFMAWLMANGGHGTYKVACYVANELACSGEFQIVE